MGKKGSKTGSDNGMMTSAGGISFLANVFADIRWICYTIKN